MATSNSLFGRQEERIVCFHCGIPSKIDRQKSKPGEFHYRPCAQCGLTGIRREGDRYQELHKKKSFREAYEHSSTRGGRL